MRQAILSLYKILACIFLLCIMRQIPTHLACLNIFRFWESKAYISWWHIFTHLNTFLMVIRNTVTKFNHFKQYLFGCAYRTLRVDGPCSGCIYLLKKIQNMIWWFKHVATDVHMTTWDHQTRQLSWQFAWRRGGICMISQMKLLQTTRLAMHHSCLIMIHHCNNMTPHMILINCTKCTSWWTLPAYNCKRTLHTQRLQTLSKE